MKKVKTILKALFSVVAVIIVGSIIISLTNGNDSDNKPTNTPKQESPASNISKENFEAIVQGDTLSGEGGMTIEEVVSILGEPDTKSQSRSGDMTLDSYVWTKNFKMISVTFTNGKVSSKTFSE